MDNTETKTTPKCADCGDTGKVLISFKGASGDIPKEVSCPSCGITPTVDSAEVRDAQAIYDMFDKRVNLIVALAVIAAIVAAAAWYVATNPDAFRKVLEEATPDVH